MNTPTLRKGKTKSLLESSIDCALLAVEIYNKPRAPFRVETFITHMIMAWTRLFQAYFHHTIGETYFYKEKNGRYKRIDGEKKAWPKPKFAIIESKVLRLNIFIKKGIYSYHNLSVKSSPNVKPPKRCARLKLKPYK